MDTEAKTAVIVLEEIIRRGPDDEEQTEITLCNLDAIAVNATPVQKANEYMHRWIKRYGNSIVDQTGNDRENYWQVIHRADDGSFTMSLERVIETNI